MDEEPKPLAATIISVLGGVIIVLLALSEIVAGVAVSALGDPRLDGSALVIGGIVGVLAGVAAVILAAVLYVNPDGHVGYGIGLIVAALFSLVSFFGGLVVGFVFVLVGGILSIVFQPDGASFESLDPNASALPYAPWPSPAAPVPVPTTPVPSAAPGGRTHVGCPTCGRVSPASGHPFCSGCGAPLPT